MDRHSLASPCTCIRTCMAKNGPLFWALKGIRARIRGNDRDGVAGQGAEPFSERGFWEPMARCLQKKLHDMNDSVNEASTLVLSSGDVSRDAMVGTIGKNSS
jgi:hypothetical protein